jgi:transketolase
MGQRVIYVMTHDSIGLGEDGPTHQPVEHLNSYRAMPNMTVIRPADANETVEAWRAALANTGGPSMIVLSRQGLPVLDRKECASAKGVAKGGYVLYETRRKPTLILIASGSEVPLCLDAARALDTHGIGVRVVNMASTELFDRQSAAYREKVLPKGVRARLAVEAGSTIAWHKYVGLDGDVIGIDRFGASAPAGTLFEKFGLSVQNVVNRAQALVGK